MTSKTNEQFDKLFQYIVDFREENKKEFAKDRKSIDNLTKTIDHLVAMIDRYEIELAARDSKIARLEKYINALADKVGLDLNNIEI